jgi:hypothetical protein
MVVRGGEAVSRPRPICVEHRLEMRCAKNEVLVADRATDEFPSTFWYGDRFECPHPDCSAAIVTGFGSPMHPERDLGEPLVFGEREALELQSRGIDPRRISGVDPSEYNAEEPTR